MKTHLKNALLVVLSATLFIFIIHILNINNAHDYGCNAINSDPDTEYYAITPTQIEIVEPEPHMPLAIHLILDDFYFLDDEKMNVVRLREIQGVYYFFLPYWARGSETFVHFHAASVALGGAEINSGSVTETFSAGSPVSVEIDGRQITVFPMFGSPIPTIFIRTDSGGLEQIHADIAHREGAYFLFVDEYGNIEHAGAGDINGRGNYTWLQPKRPYNFRLAPGTRFPLFDMGEGRHWTLLANYVDALRVRNTVALNLARELGISHTSQIRPVDVFINDEYMGIFDLVERRSINHAVHITDLQAATQAVNTASLPTFPRGGEHEAVPGSMKYFDIPYNPEDITGAYLLEMQFARRYERDYSGFVSVRGIPVVVNAPEIASRAQMEYISGFFQRLEDAVYSETGYNAYGNHFSEYLDIRSFALMYIFSEFLMDVDAANSSFFMYKESDSAGSGKLYAGPPWDFDFTLAAIGNTFGVNFRDPHLWWVNRGYIDMNPANYPHLLTALYRHEIFREAVIDIWKNAAAPAIRILVGLDAGTSAESDGLRTIEYYINKIDASRTMDAILWPLPGGRNYSNQSVLLPHFALARYAFLASHWGD